MNFFLGRLLQRDGGWWFEEHSRTETAPRLPFAVRLPDKGAGRWVNGGGQSVVLGLRPEQIHPVAAPLDPESDGVVSAAVEVVEQLGAETHLRMRSAAHLFTARVPAADNSRVGQTLALRFAMSHACWFHPDTGRALD